ncbi:MULTISPECIES: zf-HC2 domain-containing protein [unclassified Micromonospora]|uniref:zf-HC2 domain-containing protein n=1 Tax=unclassified Micromonospora TaxID=2617518 RepID=UPI0036360C0C
MGCTQWHEVLSAQLDGEETAAERSAAEQHLAGCRACRSWYDRAAAISRRARLTLAVARVDRIDALLAALPDRPRRRWRHRISLGLRFVLGLVGTLQLVLGLAQVGQGSTGGHQHGAGTLTSGHLWHESAAWNVAVGAGFLFVAARRTPPTGLVPMLSAFVGTLMLLSVNDLAIGRVDPSRLVSHAFLLAGYAIVVAMSRARQSPDGPTGRAHRAGGRWRLAEETTPPAPGLRLVPSAHHGSAHYRRDTAA